MEQQTDEPTIEPPLFQPPSVHSHIDTRDYETAASEADSGVEHHTPDARDEEDNIPIGPIRIKKESNLSLYNPAVIINSFYYHKF